jgi:hypothetical protein
MNCLSASSEQNPQLLEWDLSVRPSEPFYMRAYLILCAPSIATLLDDELDLPTRQSEGTTEASSTRMGRFGGRCNSPTRWALTYFKQRQPPALAQKRPPASSAAAVPCCCSVRSEEEVAGDAALCDLEAGEKTPDLVDAQLVANAIHELRPR